jgi:tetratricopeptide (TPR) repeat protein
MTGVRRDRPSSSPAPMQPKQPWTRRHTLALVLIVLLAVGLRLAFWSSQSANNPFFNHPTLDEQTHHELAQAVASGHGVGPAPFFRAPLYYYLLGALYAIFGPNPAAARFLGCVLGTISVYLIARLGRALGGTAVGLLAGLIAAIYWPMIFFDNQLQTASLEVFLDVLMILLFIRGAQKGSWPLFLAAGIVWGLSAITRANILVIAPALLVALWLWPRARNQPAPRRLLCTVFLLVGAALPILPVTLRNRIGGGEWVPIASSGGVNFYIGNNPRSDGRSAIVPEIGYFWSGRFEGTQHLPEAQAGHKLTHSEVSSFWFDRATKWIRSHPADWARLLVKKCRLFFSPFELPNDHPIAYFANLAAVARLFWIGFPVIAVLGIAGLTLLGKNLRTWLLPLLFLLSYAASIALFFCPARFRLPVVPVLILLAALGLTRAAACLTAKRFKPLAAYVGLGALAAIFIATNPPDRATLKLEGDCAAHLQLGQLYSSLAAKDPSLREQARQHLQAAVELQPDDWSTRRSYAACCLEMGLTAEACKQLSRVVQLSADNPENFYYLGTCLETLRKPDQAADAYRRAVELLGSKPTEPEYAADLHSRYGMLLARRGDFPAAAAQFEQVLRHDPNQNEALLNLAGVLTEMERFDEAAARYRQLLARDPRNRDALRSLSHVLHAAGRSTEEVAALTNAVQQLPDDLGAASLLAWRLATSPDATVRDGPRALAVIQKTIQAADQPDASLLQIQAAAYAECGRFDEAVTAAQQALDLIRTAGHPQEAAWLEAQLANYRQNRPSRETN